MKFPLFLDGYTLVDADGVEVCRTSPDRLNDVVEIVRRANAFGEVFQALSAMVVATDANLAEYFKGHSRAYLDSVARPRAVKALSKHGSEEKMIVKLTCGWCGGTRKECGCGLGHCAHCDETGMVSKLIGESRPLDEDVVRALAEHWCDPHRDDTLGEFIQGVARVALEQGS